MCYNTIYFNQTSPELIKNIFLKNNNDPHSYNMREPKQKLNIFLKHVKKKIWALHEAELELIHTFVPLLAWTIVFGQKLIHIVRWSYTTRHTKTLISCLSKVDPLTSLVVYYCIIQNTPLHPTSHYRNAVEFSNLSGQKVLINFL